MLCPPGFLLIVALFILFAGSPLGTRVRGGSHCTASLSMAAIPRRAIRQAKRECWNRFLQEAKGREVWAATGYTCRESTRLSKL